MVESLGDKQFYLIQENEWGEKAQVPALKQTFLGDKKSIIF